MKSPPEEPITAAILPRPAVFATLASMTRTQNLELALDQIAARIVEVTASAQPDYTVGNRTVSKGAYLQQLMAAQKELQTLRQAADGAWEIKTLGHV